MTPQWTEAGLARLMNDVKKENGMDRELLELAAKAAGMDYLVWTTGASAIVPAAHRVGGRIAWNPLTDDGDALRLAMEIPACIVIDNDMRWCGVHLNGDRGKYDFVEHFGDDPGRAIRRAIVRAAAELGRAKS